MNAQPEVIYGEWSPPDRPINIRYSFTTLFDIDALVTEGFRRIPYGGIEHGGLVFGRREDNTIQIEAFRQIDCEHASGPSFSLSEKDKERLAEQLKSAARDAELKGLELVGIFISHSRRDLQATTEERNLIREVLPQPSQLLLIAKPDKFKATQFAVVEGDWQSPPFTLPLPPRQERAHRRQNEIQDTPAKPQPIPAPAIPEGSTPPVTIDEPREVEQNDNRPARPVRSGVNFLAGGAVSLLLIAVGAWLVYASFLRPPIELHAAIEAGGIVVTWPRSETAGTNEASLQIWSTAGHQTIRLADGEKQAGQTTIHATGNDVTVELIAHHWWHDRRGMVRVLR